MSKIINLFFATLLFVTISLTSNAANLGTTLNTGQTLKKGDQLTSQSGAYVLKMQTDGSLVIYRLSDGAKVYGMAKRGEFATMQNDGNFVEYASNGNWIWATHTNVDSGERRIAVLQDDGNFIICSQDRHNVYWSTGADPGYKPTGVRYPMTTSNLGTPPGIPSISTSQDDYWVKPDQVIIK